MNKNGWVTYNRNQNRLAQRRRRALGSRNVASGLRYVTAPGASKVVYCGFCKGPVVDDDLNRRRHGLKSAACKAAMLEL